MPEIKSWWGVYRNVCSGAKKATIITAETESDAWRKARDDAFGTEWMAESVTDLEKITPEEGEGKE